jgi:hypothetical protein
MIASLRLPALVAIQHSHTTLPEAIGSLVDRPLTFVVPSKLLLCFANASNVAQFERAARCADRRPMAPWKLHVPPQSTAMAVARRLSSHTSFREESLGSTPQSLSAEAVKLVRRSVCCPGKANMAET